MAQLREKPGKARYLTLPGGAHEHGETLHRCVSRECEEEIECGVEARRMLHVAKAFKSRWDGVRHQLEHLFECSIPGAYKAVMDPHADKSQIDTIWFNLPTATDRPQPAYDLALTSNNAPVYLRRFDG